MTAPTGSQTFTSSGTFLVPSGVGEITIEAWGAQGGAGANGGPPGGKGGYVTARFSVGGGDTLTVRIGSEGATGAAGANGGGPGGIAQFGNGGGGGGASDVRLGSAALAIAGGGGGGGAQTGNGAAGAGGLPRIRPRNGCVRAHSIA